MKTFLQYIEEKSVLGLIEFFDIEGRPGYSTMKWKFEVDEKYESRREEIRENHDKWFKESQDKQERAHKLLWKLIEFYIRRWWD